MHYAHLDPVRKKLRSTPLTAPPAPWRRIGIFAVGGLACVGFSRDREWLSVGSSQGVGIIDCLSGEKIARDDAIDGYQNTYMEIAGIGPLASAWIVAAGIHGGGLPSSTRDGWMIEVLTLDWPEQQILLVEPGSFLYGGIHDRPDNFHRIETSSELRAAGFSYSGNTCVVATSSDLTIYSRAS